MEILPCNIIDNIQISVVTDHRLSSLIHSLPPPLPHSLAHSLTHSRYIRTYLFNWNIHFRILRKWVDVSVRDSSKCSGCFIGYTLGVVKRNEYSSCTEVDGLAHARKWAHYHWLTGNCESEKYLLRSSLENVAL